MGLFYLHSMIIIFKEVGHQIICILTLQGIININQNLIDISFILFMKIFDKLIVLDGSNLFCIKIAKFRWEGNNIF